MHPDFFISMGNIYWALFIFFCLFLPEVILNFKLIMTKISYKYLFFPVLIFLIIATCTFTNSHPWNQNFDLLRNLLLIFFTDSFFTKLIFFIIIAFSVFAISLFPLAKNSYYILYPLSFFSLLPVWLIDSRYLILPFALFILFRRFKNIRIEYPTTVIFTILSLIFYWGYLKQIFYL